MFVSTESSNVTVLWILPPLTPPRRAPRVLVITAIDPTLAQACFTTLHVFEIQGPDLTPQSDGFIKANSRDLKVIDILVWISDV